MMTVMMKGNLNSWINVISPNIHRGHEVMTSLEPAAGTRLLNKRQRKRSRQNSWRKPIVSGRQKGSWFHTYNVPTLHFFAPPSSFLHFAPEGTYGMNQLRLRILVNYSTWGGDFWLDNGVQTSGFWQPGLEKLSTGSGKTQSIRICWKWMNEWIFVECLCLLGLSLVCFLGYTSPVWLAW